MVRLCVPLSEVATSATHGEDSPYFAGWKAYDEDPYDAASNPSGVIQMGLAENQVTFSSIAGTTHPLPLVFLPKLVGVQVSFDLLEEYLEQHPEATSWGCGISSFRENALFQDYHGLKTFRKV